MRVLRMLTLVLLVSSLVTLAHAAFRGRNGRIAFISGPDVYTMNPDGSDVKQLTHLGPDASASWEAWSPDGKQIVFVEFNPSEQIWLMNADGSNQHLLLAEESFNDERPSFAPDGTSIVFSHCTLDFETCALYQIGTDGSGLKQITKFELGIRDVSAEYAADGNSLAFTSTGRGGIICAIYVKAPLGAPPREITPAPLTGRQSDWSPDGKKLVFSTHCDSQDNPQNEEIWVVDREGGGLQRLTRNGNNYFDGPHDFFPSWSPQGDAIVFERDAPDFSTSAIYVMKADGSGCTQTFVLRPPAGMLSRRIQAGPSSARSRHLREIEEGGALPRWGAVPD